MLDPDTDPKPGYAWGMSTSSLRKLESPPLALLPFSVALSMSENDISPIDDDDDDDDDDEKEEDEEEDKFKSCSFFGSRHKTVRISCVI